MQHTIFKNRDGSIGIITPTNEALAFATIEEIAETGDDLIQIIKSL